jgi:hypothetical protein
MGKYAEIRAFFPSINERADQNKPDQSGSSAAKQNWVSVRRKPHFERWTLELLNEVVIQQPMLELIDCGVGLRRQFFESHPHQKGTPDAIALNPRFAASRYIGNP